MKKSKMSPIFLGGGGVASLLASLYFFYHHDWTGEGNFDSSMGVVLYYLVPAGVAGLLFASLKLKTGHKINLAILSVSLAAAVLGVESPTSGKAGGLTFAGPSKGPDRKRKSAKTGRSYSFRRQVEATGVINSCMVPELSNSASHPGRAGGLPEGNYFCTSQFWANCEQFGLRRNRLLSEPDEPLR